MASVGQGHYSGAAAAAPPSPRLTISVHIADLTTQARKMLEQAREIEERIHGQQPENAGLSSPQRTGPAPVREGLEELNSLLYRLGNLLDIIANAV